MEGGALGVDPRPPLPDELRRRAEARRRARGGGAGHQAAPGPRAARRAATPHRHATGRSTCSRTCGEPASTASSRLAEARLTQHRRHPHRTTGGAHHDRHQRPQGPRGPDDDDHRRVRRPHRRACGSCGPTRGSSSAGGARRPTRRRSSTTTSTPAGTSLLHDRPRGRPATRLLAGARGRCAEAARARGRLRRRQRRRQPRRCRAP